MLRGQVCALNKLSSPPFSELMYCLVVKMQTVQMSLLASVVFYTLIFYFCLVVLVAQSTLRHRINARFDAAQVGELNACNMMMFGKIQD